MIMARTPPLTCVCRVRQSKQWRCNFLETSAKENVNVSQLFQELLSLDKSRTMTVHLDGRARSAMGSLRLKEKCQLM